MDPLKQLQEAQEKQDRQDTAYAVIMALPEPDRLAVMARVIKAMKNGVPTVTVADPIPPPVTPPVPVPGVAFENPHATYVEKAVAFICRPWAGTCGSTTHWRSAVPCRPTTTR